MRKRVPQRFRMAFATVDSKQLVGRKHIRQYSVSERILGKEARKAILAPYECDCHSQPSNGVCSTAVY
jgi:hypothetical protein